MRNGELKRRESLAVEAITVLCHRGFVEARITAYRRGADPLPDWVPANLDHMEWIRLITDACHNLPAALRPSVGAGRKYRATEALRYLWTTASEVQVRWIQEVLAAEELDIAFIVGWADFHLRTQGPRAAPTGDASS